MVVACRGDGVEAGRVAEVDLSPEAAGPPEGGKVLGRGSAPMGAVLATGPDDAEQAAGVELAQVYRCFVPVQETHNTSGRESLLQFRAARREPSRGRKRPPGAQ